jgi:hypothetical protein
MFNAMEGWYDEHGEASFEEIEQEAREQRRAFMGKFLELLINGRDTGFQLELPKCTVCGTAMDFEGYKDWTIYGLEGDSTLERAYYVCPTCEGQGLFPPGPAPEAASGSLE